MIALKRDPHVRRGACQPGLDRDTFVRPIAHRGLHDADRGTPGEHRAGLPSRHRQGLRHRVRPAAGRRRHAHGVSRRQARPPGCRDRARSPPTRQRCSSRFRYKGQDQKILTFAQFLDLVDGRVPLLVEVKGKKSGTDAAFLEKIARQARAYDGPIALMSFNRSHCRGAGRARAEDPARSDRRRPAGPREPVGREQQDARKRRGLPRVRIGTRQRRLLRRRRETGGGGAKMDVARMHPICRCSRGPCERPGSARRPRAGPTHRSSKAMRRRVSRPGSHDPPVGTGVHGRGMCAVAGTSPL